MIRTQISLTEDQKRRLDAEVARTGASMSELIRQAVDRCLPPERTMEEDLRAIERSAGAWKDRDFTGEEYVESLRSGRRPEAW